MRAPRVLAAFFFSAGDGILLRFDQLTNRNGHHPPRERLLYRQPTGPNPLYHRDDLVERPRAIQISFHSDGM
jgi:hypothetical protein